jgi:hypothetical protein
MAVLIVLNLISMLVKDRAEKTVLDRTLGVVVTLALYVGLTLVLWAGDFWKPLGWPA